ncbi:MAG: aspartate kinase [Chitinophagia bacterium]|nr:aspartate kinase [Chitinophagia bacterium]
MKIMKFGGTSVGKPERMRQIAELIIADNEPVIVVLSALSGTTNALVEISHRLAASDKEGASEKIAILEKHYQNFIHELLHDATLLAKANAVLNEHFEFLRITQKISLSDALNKDIGYICRNARGEVDNLKRGGSDYTASLIAAAVKASVCEIWTDIDGMHNNDPRVVERTVAIEQLSFDEAAELAYFGAKILHPTCIWPAQQENIPVKLLNTMEPKAPGTVIKKEAGTIGVKAVAAKDDIIAVKIKSTRMLLAYGFLRKIFEVFEKYKTPIDMITTSEVAVSVTIDSDLHLAEIIAELSNIASVEVERGQTIVSIVGNKIAKTDSILRKLFNSIDEIPITMVSYGGSAHNISLLIPSKHKTKTLQLINKGLFNL